MKRITFIDQSSETKENEKAKQKQIQQCGRWKTEKKDVESGQLEANF